MLYFRNYAGPLRPAGGGGIWLAFAFYRSCLPPIANSPQMPPQLSRPCMPNVAGCGPDSSVNRWTSPGRARIAARLLPRFTPQPDFLGPASAGLLARRTLERISFRILFCCGAERDGSPPGSAPPGVGTFLRLGLRFDIEVPVIGPDRHDEVVQEALEPAQANGCGATRTTSSRLTRPPARDTAPPWL